MKTMTTLKKNLTTVLLEYIKAFESKHNVKFTGAINSHLLDVLVFGDYFINMTDIIHDIDNEIDKDVFFEWYDAVLCNTDSVTIIFKDWCDGFRFDTV